MTDEALIQTRGLQHRFGKSVALDGVDLSIHPGEVLALLGRNGAGKTTLLRLITNLIDVQDGSIERRASRIGYCPQRLVVWPDLTVREQLSFMARMHEVAPQRVDESIEALHLTEHSDKLARTLSGGTQRRLSIALATIHRPEVLVLDEPEVGLDPASRVALRQYLRGIAARGTAIVLSSHTMEEVERVADRVVLLDRGRVVESGTPAELAGDGRLEDRLLA